jgi:hypothetical protein
MRMMGAETRLRDALATANLPSLWEEEGDQLLAVAPRNRLLERRWERRSGNHEIASLGEQHLAGRPEMHILVVRGEHKRLIRREVNTLAERDRVPGCVKFEAEHEHVRVLFKLGLLGRRGNRQCQHANNKDNE